MSSSVLAVQKLLAEWALVELGTVAADHETTAGDAEAIDGALLVAPATCSVENTDEDPGVVNEVLLAAADDEVAIDGQG